MFKKEYLILFAVIIGACLYLYLKDKDRIHYQLPELATVESADIRKIEIKRGQSEAFILEKTDGQWTFSTSGFMADEKQVHDMLHALSDVRLTALVSDSGDYDRYDLDEGNAIRVTARTADNAVVRDLTVGKRATSGQYTFARVGEDPFVYHVGGSFHDTFAKTIEDLRDQTVLAFDKNEIEKISIAMADETLELSKAPAPAEASDESAAGENLTPEDEQAVWKTADDQAVDQEAIKELLDMLSDLECDSYLAGDTDKTFTNPAYTVTLTGKKTYTLSLFPLSEEEDIKDYAGISSENPSAFKLLSYKAGRIMKKPSDLQNDQSAE